MQTANEQVRALSRYEPGSNTWTQYRHRENDSNGLAHSKVLYMSATGHERHCLLEDAQGTNWVVTRTETADGAEAILHRYDRAHDRFVPYRPEGIAASDPVFKYIKLTLLDRKGTLWVPTFKQGLFRINPATNKIIAHYRNIPGNDRTRRF